MDQEEQPDDDASGFRQRQGFGPWQQWAAWCLAGQGIGEWQSENGKWNARSDKRGLIS